MTQQILDHLLKVAGEAALKKAQLACPSITLRQAMRLVRISATKIAVHVPHYWAIYYHDGRGKVNPVTKAWLVYFRNPRDDPRLIGGYPVRAGDLRRLTTEEFRYWGHQNYLARIAGQDPPMIVVRQTGPAVGHPFFTIGMRGFLDEIRIVLFREFEKWLLKGIKSERRVARAIL